MESSDRSFRHKTGSTGTSLVLRSTSRHSESDSLPPGPMEFRFGRSRSRKSESHSEGAEAQKRAKIIKVENSSTIKIRIQREKGSTHETELQGVKTEPLDIDATANASNNSTAETLKDRLIAASATKKAGSTCRSPTLEKGKGTDKVTDMPQENGVDDDPLSALFGPPGTPDLTGIAVEIVQSYTSAIFPVKKALISFLAASNPKDVHQMIIQANSAFSCLKGLNADYMSFYNRVRSYILCRSELCKAGEELEENMEYVRLVSRHEKLVCQSSEAARAVSEVDADLEKAKKYMAPLEARVQDTRDLLEKLEVELGERQSDIANLKAARAQHLEAKAAADAKLQDIVIQAEEARSILRDILCRQEAAKAAVEESKDQLTII